MLQADAGPKYFNPFDSITKLQLLSQKAKTCDNLVCCVRHIWHLCKHQHVSAQTCITMENLRGSTSIRKRSIVDLWLLKRELLLIMLQSDWAAECNLDTV